MEGPLNCCELQSDVNVGGYNYLKGDIIGGGDACHLGSIDHLTKEWGLVCLLGSIGAVTRWIFTFLMVVSPVMILTGTYYIMTGGGDPEKLKKGKNFIIWASIGLVVGLFSNAIPGIVTSLLY